MIVKGSINWIKWRVKKIQSIDFIEMKRRQYRDKRDESKILGTIDRIEETIAFRLNLPRNPATSSVQETRLTMHVTFLLCAPV